MSYLDAYQEAWKDGGPAGALAFLKVLFHHPDNQHIKGKPTDYLSDRDDKLKSPKAGFDQMIDLFSPKAPIAERVAFVMEVLSERRSPQDDERHRSVPFNAFLLNVSTYDHGDASLYSIHLDPETRAWKCQYGLQHELIHSVDNFNPDTDDDDDSYDFIYKLENSDHYKIQYEGEVITGTQLFRHIRMAQYGQLMARIVDAIWLDEGFADFPKLLPFRFLVNDSESSYQSDGILETLYECRPALTEESLLGHPREAAHRKSSEPPAPLTPAEEWQYLMAYLAQEEAPERGALIALLKREASLVEQTLVLANQALAKGHAPAAYAALFWALGDDHRAVAQAFTRKLISLPIPELPRDDIESAIEASKKLLSNVFFTWKAVPQASQPDLQGDFDEARKKLGASWHPVLRLLTQEAELRMEHGNEVIVRSRHGATKYQQEKIPESYVDTLGACIEEMPKSFEWYGDKWDFVMYRIQGLGTRARKLAPRLVQLLDAYCTNLRDGGQCLENFARILYKIGLEEPPKLIRDYAEDKTNLNLENYATWAAKVPQERWEAFVGHFVEDPKRFHRSAAWQEFLYASKKGMEIFCKGIDSSEEKQAMLDAVFAAAKDSPGELFTSFVYSLADFYNAKRHKPEDCERTDLVIRLCGALPELDAAHAEVLMRAELLRFRFAIDTQEADLGSKLEALLSRYPNHAMLLFNRAELAMQESGGESAGRSALDALETLSETDLVYRKAFFQFTGNSARRWEAATTTQGYAAFRWAATYLRKDGYRNGGFADGQAAIDHDPFYKALLKLVAPWSDEERAQQLEGIAAELAFGETLRTLSDEELALHLTPTTWSITLQIVQRLVARAEAFEEPLVQAYTWFHEQEDARLTLASLYWPIEALHEPLLRNEAFVADLPWFIQRYPGIGATDLAKIVFTKLTALGRPEVVLQCASELQGRTVIGAFLSVSAAIQKLGRYDEGIVLLDKILADTSPKKPEYVLMTSNRGVFEYISGDGSKAAATFDALFAMDWSRFDYDEDEDDMMKELLGGDLDAQISAVFQQYFASAKFNAACVYANLDRSEDAVAALGTASTMLPQIYTVAKLASESDFDPIRNLPSYQDLIAKLGA